MFDIPYEVISATTHEAFSSHRSRAQKNSDRDVMVEIEGLSSEALDDLCSAAEKNGNKKIVRTITIVLEARKGNFDKSVPNFKAFPEMLRCYLGDGADKHWVFVEKEDGHVYPELIFSISDEQSRNAYKQSDPLVTLTTIAFSKTWQDRASERGAMSVVKMSYCFEPEEVTKKKIPDILKKSKIFKETEELHSAYESDMKHYEENIEKGFTEQFRASGKKLSGMTYHFDREDFSNTKVVHDVAPSEIGKIIEDVETPFLLSFGIEMGKVPRHPVVRVFELGSHEFYWVNARNLTPYAYDETLRDKIVLPSTHRDLLDILTTDIDAFVDDFIEGKSAGNVILCKGIPGVGKTLTAEVYAELMKRPLYVINTGTLGTTANAIENSLKIVFKRAKRWNCVLLLDEADVFVVRRGADIEQNAIVAEFLRTLEYFDGLLFMTTNRPDDIDEAIISRCAAIIDYHAPNAEDAAKVWHVMARQFDVELPESLIEGLIGTFPSMTPRDIKMLLRLALRVAGKRHNLLDMDLFRRCAMFRAVEMIDAG